MILAPGSLWPLLTVQEATPDHFAEVWLEVLDGGREHLVAVLVLGPYEPGSLAAFFQCVHDTLYHWLRHP